MFFSSVNVLLLFAVVLIFEAAATDLKRGDACVTPNQENATCIPLYECDVLFDVVLDATPETTDFLMKSICAPRSKLVCCGSSAYLTNSVQPDKISLSLFSDGTVCGLHALTVKKINGGTAAEFSEFPWVAALEYKSTLSNTSVGIRCGGSVINDRYVLTAAHCIVHIELVIIMVWLGATNITTDDNCINLTGRPECLNSIKKFNVEKAIVHPRYQNYNKSSDIGLLRLEKKIVFSYYIRPICLLSLHSPSPIIGTYMTVAGWGRTDNSTRSDIKLKVDVPVQDDSICNKFLAQQEQIVAADQLCVGGEAGKDSCQGDSGGPLMKSFSKADRIIQWYQAGIVSHGYGCGISGIPTIYTRVSAYEHWISTQIYQPDNNLNLKSGDPCVTPNQENATCIPVRECPVLIQALLNLTAETYEFLLKSKCGSGVQLVCCGPSAYRNNPPPLQAEEISLSRFSNGTVCGLHALTPNKINGGMAVEFSEFPWLAALEYESKFSNTNAGIRCGGSVINNRYVLTAAHCIVHIEFVVIKVWLGATNISSDDNCVYYPTGKHECANSIQKFNVAKAIVHSLFQSDRGTNDIGLLRLEKEIIFTHYIRPVCLPSPVTRPPIIGTYMAVAGWGATENNRQSDIKRKVDVPVQNNSICNGFLSKEERMVNSNQLCVGGETGKDSCQGDSGGPLMKAFTNENHLMQWYQEGIVSYGVGCGINKRPSIYTRVSAYDDWIATEIMHQPDNN